MRLRSKQTPNTGPSDRDVSATATAPTEDVPGPILVTPDFVPFTQDTPVDEPGQESTPQVEAVTDNGPLSNTGSSDVFRAGVPLEPSRTATAIAAAIGLVLSETAEGDGLAPVDLSLLPLLTDADLSLPAVGREIFWSLVSETGFRPDEPRRSAFLAAGNAPIYPGFQRGAPAVPVPFVVTPPVETAVEAGPGLPVVVPQLPTPASHDEIHAHDDLPSSDVDESEDPVAEPVPVAPSAGLPLTVPVVLPVAMPEPDSATTAVETFVAPAFPDVEYTQPVSSESTSPDDEPDSETAGEVVAATEPEPVWEDVAVAAPTQAEQDALNTIMSELHDFSFPAAPPMPPMDDPS